MGDTMSAHDVNPEACRTLFRQVDADRVLANAEHLKVETALSDMKLAAKHVDIQQALGVLLETSMIPLMVDVINKMSSATFHGNAAVHHMVMGDEEMEARANMSAGRVVAPDMPGAVN